MFLKFNKTTVLLLVILVIISSIFYLEKQKVAPEIKSTQAEVDLKEGKFPKSPELTGISGYFNTKEDLTIESLKGKVVLIDFWTYTCVNCIRTLPFLTEWDRKYKDKGLVIVGVHTPEFEFEKNKENVQAAIEKYNIEYPVVQDNDYATWIAFRNRYWPHKFLIDRDGFIRYDHIGEGAYEETERQIQELLEEIGENVQDMPTVKNPSFSFSGLSRTPELYAGYKFSLPRGQNIGNQEGLQPDQIISYSLPENINKDTIYLDGTWKSNADDLESSSLGSIILDFTGTEVNIVSAPSPKSRMEIKLNNNYLTQDQAGIDVTIEDGISYIDITEPQLYNVYKGPHTNALLELSIETGFKFSAFTFG